MEVFKDLALVLKTIAYQDRHRIVTALTQNHGQITVLAKNAIQSRRFGGSLDLFVVSEWQFTMKPGAELYFLNETQVRESFEGLRKDFQKLSLASVLNEVILRITPEAVGSSDFFRLLFNSLTCITECQAGIEVPLLNAFLAKILQCSGHPPLLTQCASCDTRLEQLDPTVRLSLSISKASWVCPTCSFQKTAHLQDRHGESLEQVLKKLSVGMIQEIKTLLEVPIRQVPLHIRGSIPDHHELFEFFEAFMIFHLPGFDRKPLNGIRFLGLKSNLQPEGASRQ
ncbi:MAG: DNA repair protein RecO [Bdellovibrionia bacterium]